MDFPATNVGVMDDSVKHIHCWQTAELFSKFKFHDGSYNNLNLTEYLEMKR